MIPNQYTVWEKIDFVGPNLKAKNILDYFKNKYNVEIENINFNETNLVSTILDDEESLEKSIEELMEENEETTKFHINDKTKYVQLEISGSDNNKCAISTPTIRYILKGKRNNDSIQFYKE